MEVMITLGNVKLKFRISFIASIYTINVIMHHGKQVGGTMMMTRQTNTCKLIENQGQAGQQKLNLQEINDIGRFSYSINLVAFLHTTKVL